MKKLFNPDKVTLSAFAVLFVGLMVIPPLASMLQALYISSTSTNDSFARMMHTPPNPLFIFIFSLLYIIWLYVLGCVIVYLARKKKK